MPGKKFRVGVLVRMFPNIVQTYVLNHIISLIDSGIETTIIAEMDPNQVDIHPNIDHYGLKEEAIYINVDRESYLREMLATPVLNPRYLKAVAKLIFSNIWIRRGLLYGLKAMIRARALARKDVDIIHSHSLFCTYDYLFLKEIFSIPLTTTFHGLIPKSASMQDPGKTKAVVEVCDAFFVNTVFAQQQLTGLGCSIDKIHIIPQGTNIADFPFKRRAIDTALITILSVGRLSVEKGFHIGIRAIAKLGERYPGLRYHIVGSGPEEKVLRHLIDELDLTKKVQIFGSVSTKILKAQYSEAHLFLLPSIDFRDGTHTETQGVVLQEAQSSGIPVIASRTGGIPEVIRDGKTGLLFAESNTTELADLIERLISDSSLYESISREGMLDVKNCYSSEIICRKLTRIYYDLLNK